MGADQPVEVFDGRYGQLDPRHGSELAERDRVSGSGLLEPAGRPLERAGDPIEDLDDAARVDVRLVDGPSQEGPSERSLLHVRALGQSGSTRPVYL